MKSFGTDVRLFVHINKFCGYSLFARLLGQFKIQCTGDYEDVIPLIDAYDKAQSDTGNDMEYFTDAYLCIPISLYLMAMPVRLPAKLSSERAGTCDRCWKNRGRSRRFPEWT